MTPILLGTLTLATLALGGAFGALVTARSERRRHESALDDAVAELLAQVEQRLAPLPNEDGAGAPPLSIAEQLARIESSLSGIGSGAVFEHDGAGPHATPESGSSAADTLDPQSDAAEVSVATASTADDEPFDPAEFAGLDLSGEDDDAALDPPSMDERGDDAPAVDPDDPEMAALLAELELDDELDLSGSDDTDFGASEFDESELGGSEFADELAELDAMDLEAAAEAVEAAIGEANEATSDADDPDLDALATIADALLESAEGGELDDDAMIGSSATEPVDSPDPFDAGASGSSGASSPSTEHEATHNGSDDTDLVGAEFDDALLVSREADDDRTDAGIGHDGRSDSNSDDHAGDEASSVEAVVEDAAPTERQSPADGADSTAAGATEEAGDAGTDDSATDGAEENTAGAHPPHAEVDSWADTVDGPEANASTVESSDEIDTAPTAKAPPIEDAAADESADADGSADSDSAIAPEELGDDDLIAAALGDDFDALSNLEPDASSAPDAAASPTPRDERKDLLADLAAFSDCLDEEDTAPPLHAHPTVEEAFDALDADGAEVALDATDDFDAIDAQPPDAAPEPETDDQLDPPAAELDGPLLAAEPIDDESIDTTVEPSNEATDDRFDAAGHELDPSEVDTGIEVAPDSVSPDSVAAALPTPAETEDDARGAADDAPHPAPRVETPGMAQLGSLTAQLQRRDLAREERVALLAELERALRRFNR